MSNQVWQSQLEINQIFDKRIALSESQVTALTELVIAQGKLIEKLSALIAPKACGKHCACDGGN